VSAPATAALRRIEWAALDQGARQRWLAGLRPVEPRTDVATIIAEVRERGDSALRELTARFDGVELTELWVSADEFDAAQALVSPRLRDALEAAIGAVDEFHRAQLSGLASEPVVETLPGVRARRRFVPLRRAGGYVPGGRAALASSVIMLGVPARLAGVGDMVLATPPDRLGNVAPSILVAAQLVGVRSVLKVGGAQAIAALAYGTQSVAAVDRIFGAGNAWVTAAKRAVSADVAIDLPAGPSECVVVADEMADPRFVALDLLAQAEHGPDSVALLLTTSAELSAAVEAALLDAGATLATGEAATGTLRRHGWSVVLPSLEEAVGLVEDIAPEHVSLQCAGAAGLAERIGRAGAVFIGSMTPVAAGDYATGTNHLLPTGGAASAWSGVGVEAFGRWLEVVEAGEAGLRAMAATVAALAEAEGMAAHAASVVARAAQLASDGKGAQHA
jgi:histidinol dehydrogenase